MAAGPTGPTETAFVGRVVDGDTIVVTVRGRRMTVRYIGIDTPETVEPGGSVEPLGPEATDANAQLVEGREVVLERDISETDRFGRLLRHVWLRDDSGWRLVNLELVARGLAVVSTFPPDVKYVDPLLAAQAEARAAGRGLWGPQPSPAPGSASGTAVRLDRARGTVWRT